MITTIDFSEYEHNGKFYGGSERKEGITIDPLISEIQKKFYKHMINARYRKILLNSFEKLDLEDGK